MTVKASHQHTSRIFKHTVLLVAVLFLTASCGVFRNRRSPAYYAGKPVSGDYRPQGIVDEVYYPGSVPGPTMRRMIVYLPGDYYQNEVQFNDVNISYTRTFNNTKWQALYIPFSLSYDDWKDDFEVAYINGIRQYDKNDDGAIDETIMDVIKIKEGSLIPNTPYLIKAKSVGEKTFSLTDATLYPAEENSIDCRTTIAEYTFTGTYSTIPSATLIANQYYAMGGGELIISDGSNDLKPYRWYMKIDARSPMYNTSNAAKAITINVVGEESETTGICQLQMNNDKLPVCDLNGRRVSENSLKPGVYIKNGKKVIIK